MYRKITIKSLVILFSVLLVLTVIVRLIDWKKGEKSFEGNIVEYQTELIDRVLVFPKVLSGKQVELKKENNKWQVIEDGKIFSADQSLVQSVVDRLNKMSPDAIATSKKERWTNFELEDSQATRIQLFQGTTMQTEIFLGKYSFSNSEGKSYIRKAGNNTVYRISGSQASDFNRDFNGFKDKTVLRVNRGEVVKFDFSYPADSSFVLEKIEEKWLLDGQNADSVAVEQFISGLTYVNHYQIVNEVPHKEPDFKLKINNKTEAPIDINGFIIDDRLLVHSSLNRGVYFDANSLKDKLFSYKKKFISR